MHMITAAGRRPLPMRSMPRMKAFTPARSSWCICAASRDCASASASSTRRMTAPRALAGRTLQLGRFSDRMVECGGKKLRHLADAALSARREAHREQRDVDASPAARRRRRSSRQARTCRRRHRRPAPPAADGARSASRTPFALGMMLLRPRFQSRRIDEQAEDLRQARLVIVETDETGQAFLGVHIGIGDRGVRRAHRGWACCSSVAPHARAIEGSTAGRIGAVFTEIAVDARLGGAASLKGAVALECLLFGGRCGVPCCAVGQIAVECRAVDVRAQAGLGRGRRRWRAEPARSRAV